MPGEIDHGYNTPRMVIYYDISLILIFVSCCFANNLPIEISGNTFFSSAYLTANTTAMNGERDVENFIDGVLTKYSDAGFPFCRIFPEVIYHDNTVGKIILNVEEGERVVISDYLFDIQGKSEVPPIKKIMRLQTDRYFSSKEIAWSKNLLLKTGAFEEIADNITHRNDKYYVLFNIIEKRSDYLTAFGSFAEEGFNEENFNFGFSFFSLNLLGTLRQLQFRYEYKKLFLLQFTEPVLIAPSVFDLRFSIWTYDSVRLTEFNGTFTAPLGRHFSVSLTTGIEAVTHYDDSDDQQHIDNVVGLGFGMDYSASGLSCFQKINFEYLFREFDRRSIMYDGEVGIGAFVIKPHYYWVKADSFEYFDYFRIGGAEDMRGYLEEEFIVSKALWFNVEYRKFFLFPIFDIGLIGDDVEYSYGFGIAAESDFANASLMFAWPKGGTWRDGKVHLLFEKGF